MGGKRSDYCTIPAPLGPTVQRSQLYKKHFKFPVLIYDVFRRLAKEKEMYEKEVKDQGAKVDKMKAEDKDEYDIKKQVNKLLSECIVTGRMQNSFFPGTC